MKNFIILTCHQNIFFWCNCFAKFWLSNFTYCLLHVRCFSWSGIVSMVQGKLKLHSSLFISACLREVKYSTECTYNFLFFVWENCYWDIFLMHIVSNPWIPAPSSSFSKRSAATQTLQASVRCGMKKRSGRWLKLFFKLQIIYHKVFVTLWQ